MKSKKIGIVIGRMGGEDGVALETDKWITVLKRMGHEVCLLCGELEGPVEVPVTVCADLAFGHPDTVREQQVAFLGFHGEVKEAAFMAWMEARAGAIQAEIEAWIRDEELDLLLAENASALPFHLALGVGLYEAYQACALPVITHDHDFPWERGQRYVSPFEGVNRAVARCFPAVLPNVQHAVINSPAASTLATRFGVTEPLVVPNVMDFERPYAVRDEGNAALPADLGLSDGDIPLFQVTRVVERKGIETAIELVRRLDLPAVKLVITGDATDDDEGYIARLHALVARHGLHERVRFAGAHFGAARAQDPDGAGPRVYSIEDAYAHARGCTYFSTYEGFGNAFVEAVVARRPIFVNDYEPVYWPDIGSLGFDTVMIRGGQLTDQAVEQVREVLTDPGRARRMTDKNFQLGREHFSLETLEGLLRGLLGG